MVQQSPIAQYEFVNIVKMGEVTKVEDPLSESDIKNWPSNICRLCAQESTDVVQIFGDEGIALRLPEIISACLPIIVNILRQDLTQFLTWCHPTG